MLETVDRARPVSGPDLVVQPDAGAGGKVPHVPDDEAEAVGVAAAAATEFAEPPAFEMWP